MLDGIPGRRIEKTHAPSRYKGVQITSNTDFVFSGGKKSKQASRDAAER